MPIENLVSSAEEVDDDDGNPTLRFTPADSFTPTSRSGDNSNSRRVSRRSVKLQGVLNKEDRAFGDEFDRAGTKKLQPRLQSLKPSYHAHDNSMTMNDKLFNKFGKIDKKPVLGSGSSSASEEGPPPGYTPGDAVKSKKPKKKNKGELTARERNRMMYDMDMNEAIMAFDMNDIKPLTRPKISTPSIPRTSSSIKEIPIDEAAILLAAKLEQEKELRREHGIRMQKHRDKIEFERYGNYEKSKVIPFKQLKENRAIREAEDLKKKTEEKGNKKANEKAYENNQDKKSKLPNNGKMYVNLLRKQLIRLDNFKNIHNVNKQSMPYELPKPDESNAKYMVKNENGKMVRIK